MKMHADQVDIDVGTVVGLVADQFPDLAGLRVEPVRSTGTVNAIFRLGGELCVRLPQGRATEVAPRRPVAAEPAGS